jgi:hypothetical protein
MRPFVLAAVLTSLFACGGSPPASSTAPTATVSAPPQPEPSASTTSGGADAGPTETAKADAGAPTPMTASDLVASTGDASQEMKVGGSQPTVGDRPQGETQPILDNNLKAVAHCYGAALKRSPKARGRLNVKITVEADGKVSSAVDGGDSSVTDKDLTTCVLGTYKKLRFSKTATKGKAVTTHAVFFGPDAV